MRRLLVLTITLALGIAGCSSDPADPSRVVIRVDAKNALNVLTRAFLPRDVIASPGGSVSFKSNFQGDPHTITFGSVIDEYVSSRELLPSNPPPASSKRIPQFFSAGFEPVSLASEPCFVPSGGAMPKSVCAKERRALPAFDGKAVFYNSGFVPDERTFTVELDDKIEPGTYRFMCLVHREDMTGKIDVVPKGIAVSTPEDVAARGAAQEKEIIDAVKPSIERLSTLPSGIGQAGVIAGRPAKGQAATFVPAEASIKVGNTMSWTVYGTHTFTFEAPKNSSPWISVGKEGAVSVNRAAIGPTPKISDPVGSLFYTGEQSGEPAKSSGLIDSFDPGPVTYRVLFNEAGAFKYQCLIHTDMDGVVRVS